MKKIYSVFLAVFILAVSACAHAQSPGQVMHYSSGAPLLSTDCWVISKNGAGTRRICGSDLATYLWGNAPGTTGQVLFNSGGSVTSGSAASIRSLLELSAVAATGAYADLSGAPSLATVATSGLYSDLSELPPLGTMAAEDVINYTSTGGLAAVALSGDYADLLNSPALGSMAYTSTGDYYTAASIDTLLGGKSDTGHSHSGLVPAGGSTGQVLKKVSNADYDTAWAAESGGGTFTPTLGMKFNDDHYHGFSTTFLESTTLANYGLAQSASGGNAQLSSNNVTLFNPSTALVSHLYLSTNAGATNVGGAYTRPFPNNGDWLTGDTVEFYIGGVVINDMPTETEDFVFIGAWLTSNTAATSDEDATTVQNVFFRADRNNTNWMMHYVDDSNVQQSIDTGVAVAEDVAFSFKVKVVKGATDATTTLEGWVNGTQIADVSGLKAWNSVTSFWPGRLQKLAGTTNRFVYVDGFAYLIYKPDGITAR